MKRKKMEKSVLKKWGSWLMLLALILTVFCQNPMECMAVTPSSTDYRVFFRGTRFFIHNEKAFDAKIGTEYFMTYTVESASQNPTQHGLIGTADVTRNFPYTDGGFMRLSNATPMLDEGATYFIRFTVSEGGYRYNVTRAKNDTLENIYFDKYVGDGTDDMKYFGIWLAYGGVEAELSNVRFYDAKGNDFGVKLEYPTGAGCAVKEGVKLGNSAKVKQNYDITITDQCNIAISNQIASTSKRIFMEYKVTSGEYQLTQNGVSLSDEPTSDYPHRYGGLNHISYPEAQTSIDLLEVGAEYRLLIERGVQNYHVVIQKTKDGKTETSWIYWIAGIYDGDFPYVSLWLGAGGANRATFKLENFKIYDEEQNNLGVQCNVNAVIMNRGEPEDYAGCEAAYYCKETNNIMALYKEQILQFTAEGETVEARYRIKNNELTAYFADGNETYEYLYKRITDKDGNTYNRLYNYQVAFVTGSDTKIETQNLSNTTGYFAMRPENPKLEDYEFEGWYTSDGTEFDFEKIVTESVTLYAKWSGDGGVTFMADDTTTEVTDLSYLWIGAGVVAFIAGLMVCVLFIRKGTKNEGNKKK